MLEEVCKYLNNYFVKSRDDMLFAEFQIADGAFNETPGLDDLLQAGQYFRIVGSVFNDGIYQWPVTSKTGLKDETFNGAVWAMSIPKDFLALVSDIENWLSQSDVQEALQSPYQSESFNNYSYSKEAGGASGGFSWQSHFGSRLNLWKRATTFK